MNAALPVCLLASALIAGGAAAQTTIYFDDEGDAVVRRTDRDATGPIRPGAVLPDLIRAQMSAWRASSPATDPYTGSIVDPEEANLFRIDLEFAGLINPPGPLGAGIDPWDPFRFGPSPVFGSLDINLDDDKDTGGELGSGAELRFLANVARFGGLPEGSIASRAARSAEDYDGDFYKGPQFERSGADFAISFCGCWNTTIVQEGGDGDGLFEAGETWLIRGRFFQRAGGFRAPSIVSGGSDFGAYDPWSTARWSHDDVADITTFTFVGPLDMQGAAQLFGGSVQAPDTFVDNHWSVEEAILDIIDSVKRASGPAYVLMERWEEFRRDHHLDPERWRANALFGTAYDDHDIDALFIWTDVGFECTPGDLTADGFVTPADADTFRNYLYDVDGSARDGDGVKNGVFAIVGFAANFSLYDIDYDGFCEGEDLYIYGDRADLDGDGERTFFDFLVFQNLFGAADMRADFDLDEQLTIFDFLAFQNAFSR